MRSIIPSVVILLFAACTNSPVTPTGRHVTFTGDYVDGAKHPVSVVSISHSVPAPPLAVRKAGVDAYAVIAFMIEKDGSTSQVQIASATDEEFGEAARQAVAHWRYAPPMQDGQNVRVALEAPVAFTVRR